MGILWFFFFFLYGIEKNNDREKRNDVLVAWMKDRVYLEKEKKKWKKKEMQKKRNIKNKKTLLDMTII